MHDPVYAVSSSTLAKLSVPREIFESALHNMEAARDDEECVCESRIEAAEICMAMASVMGECADLRETVVCAIARYLWADAWSAEMAERGTLPSGCEYTSAAPETHPKAVECAETILSELEKLNNTTIEEISAKENFEPYELGGQLAGHMLYGCDDLKNEYKAPYCDSVRDEFYGLFPEEES